MKGGAVRVDDKLWRREYMREYMRRRRAARSPVAYCPMCGKIKAQDEEKAVCAKCREKQNRAVKALRRKRAEEGLCVRCGKRPPEAGRSLCAECAAKQRESKIRFEQRRKAQGAAGGQGE